MSGSSVRFMFWEGDRECFISSNLYVCVCVCVSPMSKILTSVLEKVKASLAPKYGPVSIGRWPIGDHLVAPGLHIVKFLICLYQVDDAKRATIPKIWVDVAYDQTGKITDPSKQLQGLQNVITAFKAKEYRELPVELEVSYLDTLGVIGIVRCWSFGGDQPLKNMESFIVSCFSNSDDWVTLL